MAGTRKGVRRKEGGSGGRRVKHSERYTMGHAGFELVAKVRLRRRRGREGLRNYSEKLGRVH